MLGILFTILCVLIAAYALWSRCVQPAAMKNTKGGDNAVYIIAAAAAAFVLRVILSAAFKGHETDMNCFLGWSNAVFEHGIGKFYTLDMFHDYPPGYMYVLYVIGALQKLFGFSGGASYVLVKLPAVICDIITGIFIYKTAKRKFSDGISAIFASLYLFNPASIVNCSLWGQVDAVYTLFALLMIYFISEKKMIYSYFMFALCVFIKPQAFIFTPVLIGGIAENVFLDNFSREKLFKNLAAGLGAIAFLLVIALPFGIGNVAEQYKATMASYPHLTVNAMNLWGAFGKNWDDLSPLTSAVGYIFIAAIAVYSLYVIIKSKNASKYYFAGAILAFFTYMLSTKMHDRYAFPAVAMMIAAAASALSAKSFLLSILVSVSQFFNMAWILFIYEKDPNAYFKSPVIIIASIINLAILVYAVYVSQKVYVENNFETAKAVPSSNTAKKSAAAARKKTASKPAEKKDKRKFTPSDIFPKIRRADIIAMAVITVVYSCVALYDLGDMHAPETEYMVSDGALTLDFGEERSISKYKFFLGPYELGSTRNMTVVFSDYNKNQVKRDDITDGSVFHWEEKTANVTARYVSISTNGEELSLKEFAVLDADGNTITPVSSEPSGGSAVYDEQEEVPKRSTFRNGTYFDEIYHARTGYEFVHGMNVYEWTHPPLGKVFIAAGIKLFGMNPFGWRIAGTVFGIIMVPIIYLFALRMFKKSWLAIVTCLLFTFDFMHFTQTRIATIDVYVTFFIMLMYFFMYKYYSTSFYDSSFKKGLVSLALCGICMGLGIASKWTGVYAGAGLAVLFFISLYKRYREYLFAVKHPDGSTDGISHRFIAESFKPYLIKTIIWCCVFFIAVPLVIYGISYIPYLQAPDAHGLKTVMENQNSMYTYHAKTVLGSEHPFSSRWYEWIIMRRPIWYYSGTVSEGIKEGISSFGNPLVWWMGIPAFFYMAYLTFKKRDKNALFLVIAYLAQLVSWIPVTRLTFIYHYFPCVPFITLMIGYSVNMIYENAKPDGTGKKMLIFGFIEKVKIGSRKSVIYGAFIYAALAVILFMMFYPVLSGHPCSVDYAKHFLKWFDSWVLL